jgi:hypothetical protein
MCSDFSCFTGIFERTVINEVVKWLITKKKSFPLFWKSLLKDLIPNSPWKSPLFTDRNNLFGLKKMAEPARNAFRVFPVSLGYDRFLIINFLKRKQKTNFKILLSPKANFEFCEIIVIFQHFTWTNHPEASIHSIFSLLLRRIFYHHERNLVEMDKLLERYVTNYIQTNNSLLCHPFVWLYFCLIKGLPMKNIGVNV